MYDQLAVKVDVTNMPSNNQGTENADFFITSRAKVGNGEAKSKQKSLKYKKEDETYAVASALRKDVGALSQGTMLEQKKGEMRLIQDDLNQKRKLYEDHEEVWKKREELLQKKKKEFYEKIQDMKSFTKQTASKIEKYTEKAKEEKVQNEVKDKMILDLQRQLAAHTKKKNRLEKDLENVMECQKYLETVLKFESSFDEIDKIIKRYDILSAANSELQLEIENFKKESKETNYLFKTASKEGQNNIFELNRTLALTRNKLEKQRTSNIKEEISLRTVEDVSMKTSQLLGQVIMSVNNLYSRCQDSKRGQVFPPDDNHPLTLLDVIKTRVDDLKFIIGELQKQPQSTAQT